MHKEKIPLHQSILADILRNFFYFLYNHIAYLYDYVAFVVSLGMWNEWVLSIKPHLGNRKILELGHGSGILFESLTSDGKDITGLDLSSQMGKITKSRLLKKGQNFKLITAAAQYMPFKSGSFDQVVSTFPSDYIIDTRTLNEISRILIDEGELVLLPYAWIRGQEWYRRFSAWLFRVTGQAPEWSKEFDRPFKMMGFEVTPHRVLLGRSELPIILAKKPKSPERLFSQ